MEDGMSAKKLKDTVALLVKNGLLSSQDGEVRLTSVGERLSVLCLKEVRLDYPCVEAFIQEGYLQKLEAPTAAMPVTPATPATQAAASTVQNTPHSTAQSTTLGTDVVLPSIRWPLAPPPPSFVMGDWQQAEEEERKQKAEEEERKKKESQIRDIVNKGIMKSSAEDMIGKAWNASALLDRIL